MVPNIFCLLFAILSPVAAPAYPKPLVDSVGTNLKRANQEEAL